MGLTGYAIGRCWRCGTIHQRPRPQDFVFCECYHHCINDHGRGRFGTPMVPWSPNPGYITMETYGPIDSFANQTWGDLKNPLEIRYICPICSYMSAQQPVEVILS